ncbi:hypothetical protein HA402_008270 [Bradysia odoriphaga]|nr:hypothetical protein HA402_008270 [Bradysia odoriphaga]
MEEHVERNNIIIEEQSGFRSKHSCESALNLLLMNWKMEIAKGKKRLIHKLKQLGLTNRELEWIKSYLSQRAQSTKFGGAKSSETEVTIGLPQGSKLAAILFLLYINDIKSCLLHVMIMLFADVYYSGEDIKEIESKENSNNYKKTSEPSDEDNFKMQDRYECEYDVGYT